MDTFQLLDIYHLCHELIEGYFKSEIECFTVYTSELCLFPPWIFLRKAAGPWPQGTDQVDTETTCLSLGAPGLSVRSLCCFTGQKGQL